MVGHCLCGAVEVAVDDPPAFIHDCNCTLCRKSGAAWGYYTAPNVRVRGSTRGFARTDKANPAVEVHACSRCAATTHFAFTGAFKQSHPDLPEQVGVNMRLFNHGDLTGIEVRFPDGAAWPGAGPFGYRRDAFTITDATPL